MFIVVLLLLLWFDIIASTHQHPTSHPTNVSHQNPHNRTPKPPPQKNKNNNKKHNPTASRTPTHRRPTYPSTPHIPPHHRLTPEPPQQNTKTTTTEKQKTQQRSAHHWIYPSQPTTTDLPITIWTHPLPNPPIKSLKRKKKNHSNRDWHQVEEVAQWGWEEERKAMTVRRKKSERRKNERLIGMSKEEWERREKKE